MIQRFVVGTSATLGVTFYGGETATDPSPDTAVVTVTGASGTVYATAASATGTGVGTFTWASAALTAVDFVTAAWTATLGGVAQTVYTAFEVVGGNYASLAEIRASDPSTNNTTTWTTAKLADARARAEDQAESIMGRSWMQRCTTERLRSRNGRVRTQWPSLRTVLALSVDGVAMTSTELTALNLASSRYIGDDTICGYWADSTVIDVTYTFGEYGPPPSDVVDAIVNLARIKVMAPQSRVPDRAERFVSDANGRTFMLSSPGPDRTGYPEIDAVLHRHRLPAIA